MWEVNHGRRVTVAPQRDVSAIAFSPAASHLAVATRDGTVTTLEALTGKTLFMVHHEGAVSAIAFSLRGDLLASASQDRTVRVWNTVTGAQIARATHDAEVWAVAFDSTGRYIASASSDRTGRVWELPSAREVARVGHTNLVEAIAVSPVGRRVVTGDLDGTARVVEVADGETLRTLRHEHGTQALALDSQQRYAALVAADGDGAAWDLVSEKAAPLNHGRARAVASILDRTGRLAIARWDGLVELWNETSGSKISTYGSFVRALALHHDMRQQLLALGIDPNIVELRDLENAGPHWRGTHRDRVEAVVFSSNGRWVASASADSTACIWDITQNNPARCLQHEMPLTVVAFALGGRSLLTGDVSGSIRLWDLQTERASVTVHHDGRVTALAVTPDGLHFAAGSEKGTVGVWAAKDGVPIATIKHTDSVSGAAFISNGQYLVTTAIDGTAHVSWWRPDQLANEVCSRLGDNLSPSDRMWYLDSSSAADTCDPGLLRRAFGAPALRPIH